MRGFGAGGERGFEHAGHPCIGSAFPGGGEASFRFRHMALEGLYERLFTQERQVWPFRAEPGFDFREGEVEFRVGICVAGGCEEGAGAADAP